MRWEEDAVGALRLKGFEVVEVDGVDDYQGWGVVLGRSGDVWAVVAWSYGSCGYCDAYEDMSDGERGVAFTELVEDGMNEMDARMLFDSRKGW